MDTFRYQPLIDFLGEAMDFFLGNKSNMKIKQFNLLSFLLSLYCEYLKKKLSLPKKGLFCNNEKENYHEKWGGKTCPLIKALDNLYAFVNYYNLRDFCACSDFFLNKCIKLKILRLWLPN